MKTNFLRLFMTFIVSSALFLGGCNNDDDASSATCSDGIQNGGETGIDCGGSCPNACPEEATCDDGVQNGDEEGVDCGGSCANACGAMSTTELNGSISEDMELDPAVSYQLTGTFSVESGATLTIPAGTVITADVEDGEETSTYIVIQQGASIDVQGTEGEPVVMTSAGEEPGDWGGLVIAGEATSTEGVDATAEVGGIIYGGTDDADSSGNIDYLIINYAGAQIDAESQYNGLTLYAVGSGTTIDNVAILNGTDDGVEFFGGTVSATNLYRENNEDDAIDWTEGWSGTVTTAYIAHTGDFSTVVEADGENANPTLTNITAVSTSTQEERVALQFKKESGATITGLSLNGYTTSVDLPDNGPLANISIEGAEADPAQAYDAAATVDIALFAWANPISIDTPSGETQVLPDMVDSDLELDATIAYTLGGTLSVASGATLTIPAGTTITADVEDGEETSTYIVVQQGASIDVQGTATNPVVMTSANEEPGDWGGLVIAGEATTTEGVDATAEVGGIIYGGTDDADNSGSIQYLIINYAGAQIDAESQYNGLTLYAVGSGTTIENVAILNGTDDGVEFFGGTVSASNFYLENNQDDAIDWTEGWNGTLTTAYVLHSGEFSTVVEADGENENPTLSNITAVTTSTQEERVALQFKKESGATITGLSLNGYTTSVDLPDDGPLANISIEGAEADPAQAYDAAATVDIALFVWAGANAEEGSN